MQIAELFAGHAGDLLGYAEQVENLSTALHTRTDISTAVGILMERYEIDRHQAFAFLARNSQHRNIKVRALAVHTEDAFQSTPSGDTGRRTLRQPAGHPTPTTVLRLLGGRETLQQGVDSPAAGA